MILNTATLIHVSSAHEGEKDGKQKKKNIIILVLKARYLDRIRRSGTGTVEVPFNQHSVKQLLNDYSVNT